MTLSPTDDVQRDAVAVVVDAARTDREDLALLGLLLGGVGDDQAGRRGLLRVERLHDDAVLEGLDVDRHDVDLHFLSLFRCEPVGPPVVRGGSRTFEPARRYAVAGVVRRRKRWHSRVESANADVSTPPGECQGGPGVAPGAARTARRGPRRLRWLLTDEGQAVLARAVEATADAGARRAGGPGRAAAYDVGRPCRRGAHPGRAAPPGGARSSATWPPRMYFTPDGLEQATRLTVATHRAGRLQAAVTQTVDRPRVRDRRRPASPSRGPGSPRPASTWTRCASRWPRPTSPPSGSAAPSRRPTRPGRHRRPSTSPSPTRPAGAAGAARSTSTSGRRPGRSSRACCGATPA